MSHYRSNQRDIEFNLFEVLGRDRVLGRAPYEELDVDTARSVLQEVARLAHGPLAASFESADQASPLLDPATGTVTTENGFRSSIAAWMQSEFWRLRLPRELGGQGAPPSLVWSADEFVLGANPALWVYTSIPTAARVIWENGTARDRRLAQLMVDRGWTATMVITEPDAGSDVGSARTRAVPNDDGTWSIEGAKRFITAGDHDLGENIVHLVLARPVDAEARGRRGTKGLSLFLVPKFHVDLDTAELTGSRNGVEVTHVERKMGMTASATCEMVFGGDVPATGWLLGEVHDGINQMFRVIEDARMMVGAKAMATVSTGYLHALEHARTRLQGTAMTRMRDRDAPRVPIVEHADVRRSLLVQKSTAEGLRSLVLYAASLQDDIVVARYHGEDAAHLEALNDLLLPVIKAYSSERAFVVLSTESLQTFGGAGYLKDHPLEQYVRDSKIDSLYEGTTAIQALDLFFRKVVRDDQRALRRLLAEISNFAAEVPEDAYAAADHRCLSDALDAVGSLLDLMTTSWEKAAQGSTLQLGPEVHYVGFNATRLLFALGDLVVGWLLLRGAAVAHAAIGSGRDDDFYRGKVGSASFFARTVLPRIAGELAAARATDAERLMLIEAGQL